MVGDDALRPQRVDDTRWLGMLQRDDRGAPTRVERRADRPSLIARPIDETLRERHVPFPHGRDPDLAEQLDPGARRVDRRDRGRAVLEPSSTATRVEVLDV